MTTKQDVLRGLLDELSNSAKKDDEFAREKLGLKSRYSRITKLRIKIIKQLLIK